MIHMSSSDERLRKLSEADELLKRPTLVRGPPAGGTMPSLSVALNRLTKAKPGDVQEIAASQIELLRTFYDLAIGQARRSFRWALAASIVGLAFLLSAVTFVLVGKPTEAAIVSVISGAIVEVIAGINFYLYSKTTEQLSLFHARLDITQRFLLANSLCEGLEGEKKQAARAELISKLVSIAADNVSARETGARVAGKQDT